MARKVSKYTNRPIGSFTATGKLTIAPSKRASLTEKQIKIVKSYNRKIRKAWKERGETTKAPTIGLRQAREHRSSHTWRETRQALEKNLLGAKGMASSTLVDDEISRLDVDGGLLNANGETLDPDLTKSIRNRLRRNRNKMTQTQLDEIHKRLYDWKNGNMTEEELVESLDEVFKEI